MIMQLSKHETHPVCQDLIELSLSSASTVTAGLSAADAVALSAAAVAAIVISHPRSCNTVAASNPVGCARMIATCHSNSKATFAKQHQ